MSDILAGGLGVVGAAILVAFIIFAVLLVGLFTIWFAHTYFGFNYPIEITINTSDLYNATNTLNGV